MRWYIRRLAWGSAALALLYIVARIYFYATDDFRISNITYKMPYQADWEILPLNDKEEKALQKILELEFAYLGKGAQSYAFVSQDDRYVLKFFKFKHLKPSLIHDLLPSFGFIKEYKDNQAERKRRKLYGVFQGYKLAFDEHRLESGLLFIQLNVTGNPKRRVKIRDKIGIGHLVDLEHIPFIIQEKGQTLRFVLGQLLQKGDLKGTEERIGKIFELYTSEYNKGIYDHDHGVMYNTGFVGKRPIHLDVGKMHRQELMRQKEAAKNDMELVAAKMNAWILHSYPQYYPEISSYIQKKMDEL